jgi:hypothetical protein
MRKTVHEWLQTNHKGIGMAKKKAARRNSLNHPVTSKSQVQQLLKKLQERENKISKRPK